MSKKEMTQAQETQAQEFSLATTETATPATVETMDGDTNFVVDLTSRTTQYCSMLAETADERRYFLTP